MPSSLERELTAFLGAHHGVAILHWPRDASRVEHLARVGVPRLLLVDRHGGLSFVDSRVELPACVRPLAEKLVSHFGRPVIRQALLSGDQSEQGEQRQQRDAPCSLSKLQARASRLCESINPLGLEVVAAAGDTYVMRRCAA
jgi:hypothetical protein